ncbi:MAG: FAD-binding domain-containing protein [Fimbriiglobus sp.]
MSNNQHWDRAATWEQLQPLSLGEHTNETPRGGRTEAWRRLLAYDPSEYGRTRNFLDAPVSRLSPYLRHGMLSITEVRDHLRSRANLQASQLEEFLRQLAWRDFFEKVLTWYGRGLESDLEEPKHHVSRASRIPLDVVAGETGLPCMDGVLQNLFRTGYLHNHERLWFAAYLCHFRGVSWQAGARLFRQHLLDGDFASNSSSWQWVEGTFASKPYFMNRENIAKFSQNRWCQSCAVKCPFDADYAALQHRLFAGSTAPLASKPLPPSEAVSPTPVATPSLPVSGHAPALVWVHDAALSSHDAALRNQPEAPVVFVFDEPTLRHEPWSANRLQFVLDGLEDLFAHSPNKRQFVLVGDTVSTLRELAQQLGVKTIHLTEHPNFSVMETVEALRREFEIVVHPRPTLTHYDREAKRFSRYWEQVSEQVLGYKAKPNGNKRWHK